MTVRFLQSWNGYQPDAVVSGLTNEATLIAAGIATSDTDGGNDGRTYEAKFATDAAGNVTGLVGPDGLIRIAEPEKLPGGLFCDWENNGTLAMVSTDTGDDVALDSSVLFAGKKTIKCTFSSAVSGTYIARYTLTDAISLKGVKTIQVPVKITCNESASGIAQEPTAAFQIWLKTASGKTMRLLCTASKVEPGGWRVFTFNADHTSYLVYSGGATWETFDTEPITIIDIVQTSVAASANYPVWVGPLRANARTTGRVSIRMDGEYISQYTLIKPLLDKHGLKSSLAVTSSLIGSSASYMTTDQISEFYNSGHEVIHHTYNASKTGGYVNATDWPAAADITNDVNAAWDLFRTNGWLRGIGMAVEGYTACFISTTALARQKLVSTGLKAAGVRAFVSSLPGASALHNLAHPVEQAPFAIPGAIQITNTTTTADVIAVIDRCEELGEWGVITIHRAVESSPSSLEMTTANMDTWMAHLAERIGVGSIVCDTIGSVYKEFYGFR